MTHHSRLRRAISVLLPAIITGVVGELVLGRLGISEATTNIVGIVITMVMIGAGILVTRQTNT